MTRTDHLRSGVAFGGERAGDLDGAAQIYCESVRWWTSRHVDLLIPGGARCAKAEQTAVAASAMARTDRPRLANVMSQNLLRHRRRSVPWGLGCDSQLPSNRSHLARTDLSGSGSRERSGWGEARGGEEPVGEGGPVLHAFEPVTGDPG